MYNTFNGSLDQSVKLASGLLEELTHNPPGDGANFILAAALRRAHRDGIKTAINAINDISIDEAMEIPHPLNGQFDATATNAVLAIAKFLARRYKIGDISGT